MPIRYLRSLALVPLLALMWFGPALARQAGPEVRLGLVATFSGEGFRAGRDALEAADLPLAHRTIGRIREHPVERLRGVERADRTVIALPHADLRLEFIHPDIARGDVREQREMRASAAEAARRGLGKASSVSVPNANHSTGTPVSMLQITTQSAGKVSRAYLFAIVLCDIPR